MTLPRRSNSKVQHSGSIFFNGWRPRCARNFAPESEMPGVDEKSEVGGRCNGGELPTTVIVDGHGNVRRRFVGPRSLAVFEAMLAEAAQPQRQQAFTEAAKSPARP